MVITILIFFIYHNKMKEIAMTMRLDTTFIQIIHPVCCGLDVHKAKISACLITIKDSSEPPSRASFFIEIFYSPCTFYQNE